MVAPFVSSFHFCYFPRLARALKGQLNTYTRYSLTPRKPIACIHSVGFPYNLSLLYQLGWRNVNETGLKRSTREPRFGPDRCLILQSRHLFRCLLHGRGRCLCRAKRGGGKNMPCRSMFITVVCTTPYIAKPNIKLDRADLPRTNNHMVGRYVPNTRGW